MVYGDTITILLDGEQTGGRFVMFLDIAPPGGGPPEHYHVAQDEWFFVLEGTGTFFLDGTRSEAQPGTTVLAPMGRIHTFKNTGETPLKMLIHVAPAGFEYFLRASAAEFEASPQPDPQRLLAIADEYDVQFVA
jgi:quercetin dioxygenase-like cupin family protein